MLVVDHGVSFQFLLENMDRKFQETALTWWLILLTPTASSNATKLGALLMLLAIAMDPFSQQLIQLNTIIRFREWKDPPIARSWGYGLGLLTPTGQKGQLSGSMQQSQEMRADIDPAMEASILDGLFNELSMIGERVYMQCPTSNCRWNKFLTAGVCSQCNDLTSQLVRHDNWAFLSHNGSTAKENVAAYFLPNGAFLANLDGDITVDNDGKSVTMKLNAVGSGQTAQMMGFATGDPNKTVSMRDMRTLIWSLTAVQLNQTAFSGNNSFHYSWPNIPVIASECALYYCGIEISSNVTNNTLMETNRELNLVRNPDSYRVLNTSRSSSLPKNLTDSLEFDPYTAAIYRTNLQIEDHKNKSLTFNFSQEAVKSISSYFLSTFQTSQNLTRPPDMDDVSMTLQSPNLPNGQSNIAFYDAAGLPKKGEGIWSDGKANLLPQFATLSRSMTIAIRNSMASWVGKPGDNGGEIGDEVTVYTVRWGWITLHAILIVGSTTFFIATVRSSSEAKNTLQCLAWKNSSLAVISKAPELGPLFEPNDSILELERKAALKTTTFNKREGERLDPCMSD